MQNFATGSAGAGLMGSEPPLSPETIGRAPSIFDPPVKLLPLEELIVRKQVEPPETPLTVVPALEDERRRLVMRLVDGGEIELGMFEHREAATTRAQELVAALAAAESEGEWPEVEGRFVRPASIVSVDVLIPEE
jgi:hypothetical protein